MKYIFALLSLLTHILVEGRPSPTSRPVVKLINGSYVGVHSPEYNQDYFLGIPYAQQPVGNLRFRVPKSLNETWRGEREANAYTPFCVGYGVSSWYLSTIKLTYGLETLI
jgi:triacylglycerol lipase